LRLLDRRRESCFALDTSAATLAEESCVRERCEQASAIRAGQAEARSPGWAQSTPLIRPSEQEFFCLAAARWRHTSHYARRTSPALVLDPCRRPASGDVGSVEAFGDDAFESPLGHDAGQPNAVSECARRAPRGRLEPKLIEEFPPPQIRQSPDREAVEMQDIEDHETDERMGTASRRAAETGAQPLEVRLAVAAKTDNLAVEDDLPVSAQDRRDVSQLWEAFCPVATRDRRRTAPFATASWARIPSHFSS
jgi:hypothetical protein